jgi:hypothetical protein
LRPDALRPSQGGPALAAWFVRTKVLSESAGSGGAKDNFSSMQESEQHLFVPIRRMIDLVRPRRRPGTAAAATPEVVPTAGE